MVQYDLKKEEVQNRMESRIEREKIRDKVVDIIERDRQDLVDLCLILGGILSPPGKERTVGQAVVDWLKANGIRAYLQPIIEESVNAIGLIPGQGNGPSIILDAHMDAEIAPPGASEVEKRMEKGWVDGEMIYGTGIINCKAQVAAFMIAARALKKAGVKLQGDLTIAAVAFETGEPSVDEFQGINYPGEGLGSRWLIDRGITADYTLIGETSDFGIVAAECGYTQIKIRVNGRSIYTPRLERGSSWQENPNAFVKAAHVALALEEWAVKYEQRERMEFYGGVIVPKSQIIGMRGGRWGDVDRGSCNIYLDVWLAPGANPRAIGREVEDLTRRLGVACEVNVYHWARGYIAKNAEPLIDAIKQNHRFVLGTEPMNPSPPVLSMWRDLNAFNEVGIPAVCYGARRQKELFSEAQNRAMKISDLVAATKVYALTTISLCGLT